MDLTIQKHLETNKAILVFEKGSTEEKIKFCKEYIRNNLIDEENNKKYIR